MKNDQELVMGRTADRSFLAAALRDFHVEYVIADEAVRAFFPNLNDNGAKSASSTAER